MKYLFLAYQDEAQWASVSESERELIEEACAAHEQELRQRGYLVAVEDFQKSRTAIIVQVVNGEVFLTDSTTAETRRHLIQLFFINARDLNEAIQLIAKMPQTRKGPVEVRPILNLAWPIE